MAQIGSRRGAVNVAMILALVAFVAIAGLIYWLEVTAVPTQTEVVVEDTQEDEPVLDVPIVDLESVREESEGYLGLEVALRNHSLNSRLGSRGLWVGPEDNPFLVMAPDSATAQQVAVGDAVNLRGYIRSMSDSVLDVWEEEGAISGEGERAVASFSDQFLEASEVSRGSGDGSGSQAGGGQGGSQEDTAAQDGGGA